jgi:hypothetical protein
MPEVAIIPSINRLLSFETTRTVQKITPPIILLCRGNVFSQLLPGMDTGIRMQTHRLSFDKIRTA